MKEDFNSYTAGNIFGMALKTDRPSTSDLSGRIMFGWTGVPVVIVGPNGNVAYELEYNPATETHEDFISLSLKTIKIDSYEIELAEE